MLKRLMLCAVLVMMLVSSAYAGPSLWSVHRSNAGLADGHSDYSGARFSQVYLCVSVDEAGEYSGSFNLSGGKYSYWDGAGMQEVSGTLKTFKLQATQNGRAYELYNDNDVRTRLCYEADGGLNGVKVSWDIHGLNGNAEIPDFRTTQEQVNSFVPYVEFINSGDKVTGLMWRIVNPSDTSRPISQDFNIKFQVNRVSIKGNNNFYSGSWVDIEAGGTPEGTIEFSESVDESEIWLVEVNLLSDSMYSWIFALPEDPELSLWILQESEAQLIDGKSDYRNSKFYGTYISLEALNHAIAETKHYTDKGRITIPGGGLLTV